MLRAVLTNSPNSWLPERHFSSFKFNASNFDARFALNNSCYSRGSEQVWLCSAERWLSAISTTWRVGRQRLRDFVKPLVSCFTVGSDHMKRVKIALVWSGSHKFWVARCAQLWGCKWGPSKFLGILSNLSVSKVGKEIVLKLYSKSWLLSPVHELSLSTRRIIKLKSTHYTKAGTSPHVLNLVL